MKKIITKLMLLGGLFFVSSSIGILATKTADPIIPVFKKVAEPVPAQDESSFSGFENFSENIIKQFYHVRNNHAAFGDYNNDGLLDLYYSGQNEHYGYWYETNCFYQNLGNGTFKAVFDQKMTENAPIRGAHWSCPVWFDYNNDGYLDMLIGGVNWSGAKDSFSRLYQNMGPNEDGEYIFEEVPSAGGIRRFMNESDGGKSHQFISVGDYDKDGFIDVVVTGFGWLKEDEDAGLSKDNPDVRTERMVRLYKNNGGNGFIEIENPLNGTEKFKGLTGGSVNFADLDKDGWLDIVSTGYGSGPEAYVYWNNGDGTFSKKEDQTFVGTYNSGSGVFDMNNDGYADIIISGESPKNLFIYKNNGDRTFSLITKDEAGFKGLDGGQLAFGDINHDGLVDVLLGGHFEGGLDQRTMLYLNKGDGTFMEISNAVAHASHGSQNMIDFNNDGKLDIFALGWVNNVSKDPKESKECTTELWENTSDNMINEAPSAPGNLSHVYDAENKTITFSWDAATDDVTPSGAIRYNLFITKKGTNTAYMTIPADTVTGFIKVGEISGAIVTNSYSMTYEVDESATYTWGVQAIDNGNKGGLFTKKIISKTSNVENTFESINVNVFTSKGNIYYEINELANISVYDLSGKNVLNRVDNKNGSIQGLKNGFYIISVTTNAGTKNVSVVL